MKHNTSFKSFVSAAIVLVAAMMVSAPVFAAPPEGKGKPNKQEKHNAKERSNSHSGQGHQGNQDHQDHDDDDSGWHVEGGVLFGKKDRDYIHDFYRRHGRDCPPGLAKKRNGCLPPGQAKKRYNIGHRLPGDVPIYDIPDILRGRLPGLPLGYAYKQVDGDIAIIELATQLVVDAVQ